MCQDPQEKIQKQQKSSGFKKGSQSLKEILGKIVGNKSEAIAGSGCLIEVSSGGKERRRREKTKKKTKTQLEDMPRTPWHKQNTTSIGKSVRTTDGCRRLVKKKKLSCTLPNCRDCVKSSGIIFQKWKLPSLRH